MAKTGKTLISYNVKNGKYSIFNNGSYGVPVDMTWLTKFSKEKNLSTKELFGDGELQLLLVNDKGFTGSIGMTARDEEYEKDLGFLMEIDGGIAEIKQLLIKKHAIYFETEYVGSDGDPKVKKTWVYGITANAPSDTYDQNTEEINPTNVEYPLTIRGDILKDNAGTADYVNENGETIKAFTYSKKPTDVGYATFGDTCPAPKAPAPKCVTTFTAKDSVSDEAITDFTIIVYDSESNIVTATTDGVYSLVAGSYTYDISADNYVTQEAVSLTISAGDVTTGTKSESISLVASED